LFDSTRRLSTPLSHAVINVPACYDQLHRASIATACRCAGLEVLQLLDKPLAAALAHLETGIRLGETRRESTETEHWMVIMLNGSACEASVLEVQGLEARILSTNGDWKRGLGRWQRRLAEFLAHQFQQEHGIDLREDLVAVSRLQRACEIALDRLAVAQSIDVHYEAQQRQLHWKLERDSLPQFCGDLFNDLVEMPRAALQNAKIDPQSIQQLLLVGDLFKIPSLRAAARKSLYRSIKYQLIDQSDMARGAALQAQYLMPPTDPSGPRALVSTTYDIGLILINASNVIGLPKVLIPAATPLPTQLSRTLKFAAEMNQPKLLQFVEGTREGHPNWHRLGAINPAHAFPRRRPEDPLQMRLDVDLHGLLSGKLTWLAGNHQAIIPPLAEPQMDAVTIQQWRDWIDTMMLCQPPLES
jgi:molecular chaperone DnaK (HSP70)